MSITPKKKLCSGCNQMTYIWKNVAGNKLCKECATTGVAVKPNIKAKPIPPRSQNRSKEERLYSAKRIIFLQEHPMCEAHLPGICKEYSSEVHHKYSGKDREEFFIDEKTWMAICRNCHNWIHNNSRDARKLGFLK